jgi:hypothetical protein
MALFEQSRVGAASDNPLAKATLVDRWAISQATLKC